MSALVFLDCETTGLSLDDDIWEFAAIRREPDGSETRLHLFIEHDTDKCVRLPRAFLDDHRRRWASAEAVSADIAARRISELLQDRPHVVGAVPSFDTERIAILLRQYGHEPGWHYHLIDVENLAVGYLAGQAALADLLPTREDRGNTVMHWQHCHQLPWDSEELSRACGVEPSGERERHTAMGDAVWAMRLYDAITGTRDRAVGGGAARTWDSLLAEPFEQFDRRSELLDSIIQYAAAPPATASGSRLLSSAAPGRSADGPHPGDQTGDTRP